MSLETETVIEGPIASTPIADGFRILRARACRILLSGIAAATPIDVPMGWRERLARLLLPRPARAPLRWANLEEVGGAAFPPAMPLLCSRPSPEVPCLPADLWDAAWLHSTKVARYRSGIEPETLELNSSEGVPVNRHYCALAASLTLEIFERCGVDALQDDQTRQQREQALYAPLRASRGPIDPSPSS